jgi:hypothetical protein
MHRVRFLFVFGLAFALAACEPSFTRESELLEAKPLLRPAALAVSYGPEISPLLRTRLEEALLHELDVASVNTTGVPVWPDRVIRIDTTARSASLGTNFLVSFPGFLGFAPCWHRFRWIYRVKTWVELSRPGEPPLVRNHAIKFEVADTTGGQGLGSQLGFLGYGVPGIGAGIITSTQAAIQTRFDESLGREAGEDWARETLALIRTVLAEEAVPAPSR